MFVVGLAACTSRDSRIAILSLIVLPVVVAASDVKQLAGAWRRVFVVGLWRAI